jgi:hypothetical protein
MASCRRVAGALNLAKIFGGNELHASHATNQLAIRRKVYRKVFPANSTF